MGALTPAILLDALKREKEKRLAEESLFHFTRQAFSVIEPGNKFSTNWHIELICDALEAVTHREIDNLLLNVPPGCMKSILVSVMWPAWLWIGDPQARMLSASYGEDLSTRDAMKTREIITSEWFQRNWPYVQISKGQDTKTHYANTETGWRLATSVGGRGTGLHPSYKVVDDALNAQQAASEAERRRATEWFFGTLATRGASRNAQTVVVAQRLHEMDVCGEILERMPEQYEHICLPMRYETAMAKPTKALKLSDPRSVEGALLWPELFPEKVVKQLEVALGEYGSAGQLQQRPAPAGGGILKTAHFQKWPAGKDLPEFEFVMQSWDCAHTEKTTGDPSAMLAFGLCKYEGKQIAILLDIVAEHLSYPNLKKRVIEEWKSAYGETARRADLILVEQKASGQSILQDLRQAGIPARAYNPGKADKITRAHMVAPLLECAVIYIPESTKRKGEFVSWAQGFLKEVELFPNSKHDDQVDCFTQALIYFKDAGWLASGAYEEEDEDEYADDKKQRKNPYGT